jgi:hypothetical protein
MQPAIIAISSKSIYVIFRNNWAPSLFLLSFPDIGAPVRAERGFQGRFRQHGRAGANLNRTPKVGLEI